MGYTTEFNGVFNLNRKLDKAHFDYLIAFSNTRRMSRDVCVCVNMPDPVRIAADLPIGVDGEYFIGGGGFSGQGYDASVLYCNLPPATQPGLWCDWIPGKNGDTIEWDNGEKFYEYVEWLEYIIAHFLKPWGYVLNGSVEWRGEAWEDTGKIVVKDNVVSV
jgi:hypothetical protein